MAGPYDIGGNYQPLSPNPPYFQVLPSPPASGPTGRSYFDTNLGIGVFANGIWNYASGGGGGAVSSVFTRTGAVTAQSGDYTFAQIGSKPTTISSYGITDGVTLTGTQTLTNKTINGSSNTLSNIAESSITNLTTDLAARVVSSTFLGTIYNKTTFANTTDFTLVGSPTFSASAGVISVSGGTQGPSAVLGTNNTAFNQVAKITAYGGTTLEKYQIAYKFTVGITPAATTYGTGVGTYSINTAASLSNCIAYFNMSTATGTGTISILAGAANTTVAISPTVLTFSNGDAITITIERIGDTIYASARNNTTASSLVTCSYIFDFSVSSGILAPNTSNFSVVNFGGSYSINSIKITSNELKGANVMLVGDSKFSGYATPFDTRIAAQLNKFYPGTIVCAGQGDRTQDVLNHLTEIITLAPKTIVLCIGRNDVHGGIATGTWEANLSSIVSQLQTAGIIVWVLDALFENQDTQAALITYVQTTYPNNYIGTFAPTNVTGSVSTDTIHPSFIGATIAAIVIRDVMVLVDNGKYINASASSTNFNTSVSNLYLYGNIIQPGSSFTPVYNANDIVLREGASLTSAYGSSAQRNRLVIAAASNAAMEFRNYTGGNTSTTPAFSWFGAGTSATGTQVELIRIWEDGILSLSNLSAGITSRPLSSNPGDISLYFGRGVRGYSSTAAGNEGALIPYGSTGDTEIRNYAAAGKIRMFISGTVAGSQVETVTISPAGLLGIGQTTPAAILHLKAGTATANTAPLKLASGTNLTTTEAGAVEYDGTHLYFTATNAGTRYQLDQQTGAIVKYQHTIFTPTTGQTITALTGQENIINPAGTIAALTITLPASPSNNDAVNFTTTQIITTITYSGGTVVGAPTSGTATGQWHLVYDSATTSWY